MSSFFIPFESDLNISSIAGLIEEPSIEDKIRADFVQKQKEEKELDKEAKKIMNYYRKKYGFDEANIAAYGLDIKEKLRHGHINGNRAHIDKVMTTMCEVLQDYEIQSIIDRSQRTVEDILTNKFDELVKDKEE